MVEVILGGLVSLITWLVGKVGINKNWIVVGLSIFFGALYYVATVLFPEQLQWAWENILAIYGVSQIVYNFVIKLTEKAE